MDDRSAERDRFIAHAGWGDAATETLTGDASSRRYLRLIGPRGAAILMDAPPDSGEDPAAFLRVGDHLAALGLSVPACHAADLPRGFLLLEDSGRDTLADLIAADASRETGLYTAATEALLALHDHAPPCWAARYDASAMARAIRPAWDWYLNDGPCPASQAWSCAESLLESLLAVSDLPPPVLLHRDYHAENLIWLPGRRGPARVGMLDFQDALAGSRAYDLASLLQDARRDVSPGVEAAMIALYADRAGIDTDVFARAYAAQAAQRQIRILGVFSRLARIGGKAGYLALLPRVFGALTRDLAHPYLAPLKEVLVPLLEDAAQGGRRERVAL